MVFLWIASRQDNITNTQTQILSLPYPECKWLLIPDKQFLFSVLYFFHSQYHLPSAGEVSREAFQMSQRFLILLLLNNCGKQKITALHSLNSYFFFVKSLHCPLSLQTTVPCRRVAQVCGTHWGVKLLLKRKDFLPSGSKVQAKIISFCATGKGFRVSSQPPFLKSTLSWKL